MDPRRPDGRRPGDLPASDPPVLGGEPRTGERIGPYEVVREIARGGMATVYEVHDVRDGGVRALKLLLPLAGTADALSRFRREFRALSRLHHPNVLRVYEWGMRGDRPWFTMELVQGCDLRSAVEGCASLDSADRFVRAESVLIQIARALSYVHDRGLVHRDITPRNIMIRSDGVAILMDFGVVKEVGTELTVVGEVLGTVAYIAPEQIEGGHVDARADLYSLGAVLYLMLTGRRPFEARTLQGYLEKHLHAAPRPVRELEPMVPPHLDEICLRLLAKDPADRYASAAHLRHVLGDFGAQDDEAPFPPRLVGRMLVRARIREVLDELAAHRSGAAVLLEGASGQGKSRLLDLAASYARRLGLPVARGKCRQNDRPFGAFIGVYEAMAPDGVSTVLRETLAGEDDGVVRERYPVIAAFRDLVTSRAPCVVVLDELEKADPATAELLEYLVRNTLELVEEPVVYVLARQIPDEGPAPPGPLDRLGAVHRITLEPLEASEVEELLLTVLRDTPASRVLSRRLHLESGGSPAFITDVLRSLLDEDVIVRDGDRYRLTVSASELSRSSLPMPASIRQALEERLAPLTSDALQLLQVVAAGRHRLDLDVLVMATPFDEDRVMAALDDLVEAGIVEEVRSADIEKVRLTHRHLRDVALSSCSPAAQRELHRCVGEAIEHHYRAQLGVVVEELAYQFEQAGLSPKAYTYLLHTARRHQSRSLFDEALVFLDRALRLEPRARQLMPLEEADRRLAEVHLARSRAHYALGRLPEALEAAQQAESLARLVGDPRLISRVAGELGTQLRSQGAVDEAEPYLRLALETADEVGEHALRPMPLYQLGAIAWGRGDLELAEECWSSALASAQRTDDARALAFGYNGLGILAICRGQTIQARRHLERAVESFDLLGMLAPLSMVRMNLAELYLSTGVLRKSLELAERTIATAREVQHPHGIAMGLAHRSLVLMELGRFEEAEKNAREALRLARALSVADDQVNGLSTLVKIELNRDQPEAALELVEELVPLLAEHDSEGIAPQVVAWHAQALAALGRVEEGHEVLRTGTTEVRRWPLSQVRASLAQGRALRLLGDQIGARERLQRALATAEANGYRFYQLLAHQELVQVASDDGTRSRHARIAQALSRSLAANLPSPDAQRFLARGWGLKG